jgi:hypothetical protein
MENISIVESEDLFASEDNERQRARFQQKIEPGNQDVVTHVEEVDEQESESRNMHELPAQLQRAGTGPREPARDRASTHTVSNTNIRSNQSQQPRGDRKRDTGSARQRPAKMKNLKKNSSIVRTNMIFNNVFYDITQFDISSERDVKSKAHRHRSHNSSLRKYKSNERSLNLSLERSQLSSKEQQSGISLLKKSCAKPPLHQDSQPRFQSPQNLRPDADAQANFQVVGKLTVPAVQRKKFGKTGFSNELDLVAEKEEIEQSPSNSYNYKATAPLNNNFEERMMAEEMKTGP